MSTSEVKGLERGLSGYPTMLGSANSSIQTHAQTAYGP